MNFKKNITRFLIIIIMQLLLLNTVYAEEIQSNEQINQNQENINNDIKIYSESAVLIEAQTGKILYDKGMHDRKYPASTTKVLTAILAIENCDLNEKAVASYDAVMSLKEGYTKADIQPGESFTVEELLNVLMLQSANEAANILAEHIAGSVDEFSILMNKKAKELGCNDSNFVNANGEHNENHYSSAYDLAMIARYCMKNETFRKIVTKMECSLPHTEFWTDEQVAEHGERIFHNTNNLLIEGNKYYYPYANGIKAGFTTPAKNCLISGSNKDGFEIIAVILHAETTEEGLSARYVDTINLFEYGYNNYSLDEILKEYNRKTDENNNSVSVPATIKEDNSNGKGDSVLVNNENLFTKTNIGIVKIVLGLGLLCIVFVIWLKRKRKIGKYEYINDIYKFKLDSQN